MTLYSFPDSEETAAQLMASVPNLRRRMFAVKRFANGELSVRLDAPVSGDCFVLGSIRPPEDRLAAFLLVCDTLKRQGAKSVTALLPYLSYSRQDKARYGESRAGAWVGMLLEASGVDQVFTLDLHSQDLVDLFPIRLVSLPASGLFTNELRAPDTTIVSPDEGGIFRCGEMKVALKVDRPVIHCQKQRTPKGIVSTLVGIPSSRVILYDDILDTGETLAACCRRLVAVGVTQISIFVTHALFSGSNWLELWDLNVDRIVCTNSTAMQLPQDGRISVVECAPALKPALLADIAFRLAGA